jgi:molecular chaperone HtpG
VFKPYKGTYRTKQGNYQVDIMDVCFFPENPDADAPFWAWYGKSDLLGMIDDDRSAGLRFRQNNIALGGPDKVAELFSGGEGRLNAWFSGEVHVRSKAIVPNARRDGFEHSDAWVQLKTQLAPLLSDLCKACHNASSAGNRPTVKVIASAKSALTDAKDAIKTGFSSKEEHGSVLKKVEKEEERAAKALQARQDTSEAKQISSVVKELQDVRKALEEDDNYTVKNLRSSLSRRERNVLQEVLQVIRETVPADSSGKCGKCFNTLKGAILAHFSNGEGGRDQ